MSEGKGLIPKPTPPIAASGTRPTPPKPQGFVQESFYRELIAKVNELGAARRTRLLSAQASVPQLLWLLLIAGAGVVMVLSYYLPHGEGRAVPSRFPQPVV